MPALCAQDIKNADVALYELNRVITLEPNWPEVYEQRAEVRTELVSQCKPTDVEKKLIEDHCSLCLLNRNKLL